jgi:hypothetical protein
MTHNLSFRYHADMRTNELGLELGLGSAKVEVLQQFTEGILFSSIQYLVTTFGLALPASRMIFGIGRSTMQVLSISFGIIININHLMRPGKIAWGYIYQTPNGMITNVMPRWTGTYARG